MKIKNLMKALTYEYAKTPKYVNLRHFDIYLLY